MPAIYVLDVPEFRALVDVARTKLDCRVIATGYGYFRIESDRELVFDRKELGFKPAIWYGAFTAGVEGSIVEFGRDIARIAEFSGDAVSKKPGK